MISSKLTFGQRYHKLAAFSFNIQATLPAPRQKTRDLQFYSKICSDKGTSANFKMKAAVWVEICAILKKYPRSDTGTSHSQSLSNQSTDTFEWQFVLPNWDVSEGHQSSTVMISVIFFCRYSSVSIREIDFRNNKPILLWDLKRIMITRLQLFPFFRRHSVQGTSAELKFWPQSFKFHWKFINGNLKA